MYSTLNVNRLIGIPSRKQALTECESILKRSLKLFLKVLLCTCNYLTLNCFKFELNAPCILHTICMYDLVRIWNKLREQEQQQQQQLLNS